MFTVIDKFNADGIAIFIKETPKREDSRNTRKPESKILPINAIHHITIPSDIEMKDIVDDSVTFFQSLDPAALLLFQVRARRLREV